MLPDSMSKAVSSFTKLVHPAKHWIFTTWKMKTILNPRTHFLFIHSFIKAWVWGISYIVLMLGIYCLEMECCSGQQDQVRVSELMIQLEIQ